MDLSLVMALVVSSLNVTYRNIYKQRLERLKISKNATYKYRLLRLSYGHYTASRTLIHGRKKSLSRQKCYVATNSNVFNIKIAEETENEAMKR